MSVPPAAIRIGFVMFHVVQYWVSSMAGFSAAGIVAALLLGAQLLPRAHFEKTFRTRAVLVSQIGSLIWFGVAFLEMQLKGG